MPGPAPANRADRITDLKKVEKIVSQLSVCNGQAFLIQAGNLRTHSVAEVLEGSRIRRAFTLLELLVVLALVGLLVTLLFPAVDLSALHKRAICPSRRLVVCVNLATSGFTVLGGIGRPAHFLV